jgi:adenosylcobinamide-GDP ribazoletransferase
MSALLQALRQQLRLFFIALQFFTRVPIPAWVGYEPRWLQDCARHFPLVGTLVGGVSAAVLALALQLWDAPVAVGLAMAASIWLTGGFHEDGWADSCDGLGGAVSRARALEIMKDSRIGSYGALGLILMLGLKAAALHSLVLADSGLALASLLLGHALSRAAPVWIMRALPYAGDAEHAKAKPLSTAADPATLLIALAWALLALLLALAAQPGWRIPLLGGLLAAIAATLWMQRWLRRRLGGYTGDNLGATQQLSELAWLLGLAAGAHG